MDICKFREGDRKNQANQLDQKDGKVFVWDNSKFYYKSQMQLSNGKQNQEC